MKNFLISLLTICLSFFITTFILNQYNKTTSLVNVNTENNTDEDAIVVEEESDDDDDQSEIVDSDSLDFSNTLADYDTWKDYYEENIELSADFIGVDTEGSEITKKEFLEKLKTGNYVPVKLYDDDYMYQLYRIDDDADLKISKSIKASSNTVYSYFLKEDKPFPEFSFKDLNGNLYTNDNTRGNILVVECWFIQCTACIQEFPEINNLYDKYEGHDDIIFLSLAFDNAKKLKSFLSKKEFRYPVIPNQKDFIKNEIGIVQYPSHLIIDQYGNIKKLVSDANSLTLALDTMVNGDIMEDEI